MKLIFTIIGLAIVVALTATLLMLGWNYGVVEAVDGTHRLGFWPAVALVGAAAALGASSRAASSSKTS